MTHRSAPARILGPAFALVAGAVCLACDDQGRETAPTGSLALALAPLYEGGAITRAVFDLRIDTVGADGIATPHLALEGLSTGPGGVLTFVGTCASGPDGADGLGVATATLVSLELAGGRTLLDAELPMTLVKPFVCRRGGDTRIDFVFEVVIGLDRGFTDVQVDVEQLECAAKLDCVQAFLPTAEGRHGPSFITGLSCKGAGQAALDNLIALTRTVRCYDVHGVPLPGEIAPALSNERSYTGFELAPAGSTGSGAAYWNTATLFDAAAFAGADHCRFEALGLVRSQPVGAPREAWLRVGAKAIRWDVELRMEDGALVCDGEVGVVTLGLRVDDAPVPADSRVSAREVPVLLSSSVLFDAPAEGPAATSALRLWSARDVGFPLPPLESTAMPDQDTRLWVAAADGSPYAMRFVSACAPSAERIWAIVELHDPLAAPDGRRAALQLVRTVSGDWVCSARSDGSCAEHALSEVSCTPEGLP